MFILLSIFEIVYFTFRINVKLEGDILVIVWGQLQQANKNL